jgi:hypothetical protein
MKKPSTRKLILVGLLVVLWSLCLAQGTQAAAPQPQNPQNGSIGLEGAVTGSPPTQAASITLPRDGTTVTNLPVTVSGICPNGLLVKIFKNNVFSGSVQCNNGSFSIQIDLFGSTNEIVARVFDALDQQGPDSNIIKVTYPVGNFSILNRVSLTSSYAKRGSNPGETLTWPITLSGGTGPYAVTVDWGDGKTADIISQAFAGNFDIKHAYDTPGVYSVIIRAGISASRRCWQWPAEARRSIVNKGYTDWPNRGRYQTPSEIFMAAAADDSAVDSGGVLAGASV